MHFEKFRLWVISAKLEPIGITRNFTQMYITYYTLLLSFFIPSIVCKVFSVDPMFC